MLQPLDQGILKVFKNKYNSLLNNYINYQILDQNISLKESFSKLNIMYVKNWVYESQKDTSYNCWEIFYNFAEQTSFISKLEIKQITQDLESEEFPNKDVIETNLDNIE